jgi:hypothetical protein
MASSDRVFVSPASLSYCGRFGELEVEEHLTRTLQE